VAGLEVQGVHDEGLHCHRLAPQGLSLVLDLEEFAVESRGGRRCRKKFGN